MNQESVVELQLLCGVLRADGGEVDTLTRIFRTLRPDDLERPHSRAVFAAMQKLHGEGRPVSTPALRQALNGKTGNLEGFLDELEEAFVPSGQLVHHLDVVWQGARARRLRRALEDGMRQVERGEETQETVQYLERALSQASIDAAERTRQRFRFLTDEQVEAQEAPGQLYEGILTEGGLSALIGPSGEGKTFYIIDLARQISKRGPVVLVAAEGAYSLGPRIRACKLHHEVEGSIPFYVVPQPVNLMDAGDVDAFLRELKEALPTPPVWIIFDTLAQSMVGGDENTAKDMGIVNQNCNRIRESTGAAVMLVHHTGHNMDRERGSTALRAGVDTMLLLKKNDEGVLVLSCLKQKDMEPFKPTHLALTPFASSCVIGTSEGVGPSLSDVGRAVLRSLDRSNMGDGLTSTEWEAAYGGPKSTFMLWRKRLYDTGLVVRDKEGRGARYSSSERGHEALRGEGP